MIYTRSLGRLSTCYEPYTTLMKSLLQVAMSLYIKHGTNIPVNNTLILLQYVLQQTCMLR